LPRKSFDISILDIRYQLTSGQNSCTLVQCTLTLKTEVYQYINANWLLLVKFTRLQENNRKCMTNLVQWPLQAGKWRSYDGLSHL